MDDVNNNNINININNEDGQAHQHARPPQEQINGAADNYDARKKRRLQLISVLQRNDEFFLQTRNKIDVLVEEFLDKTRDDIHNMLCDNSDPNDEEGYLGLDSDRDTEAEVETAIRFFPEVLSRRKEISWDYTSDDLDDDGEEKILQAEDCLYPIQLLGLTIGSWPRLHCNWKTVSFIPLVARLAKEFRQFTEDDRGGLALRDSRDNVLQNLVFSADGEMLDEYDDEHYEYVDDKYLQVLIQLRQMDLLKKEDIQRYNLLGRLCYQPYFAEKRFRLLMEWVPNALTHIGHWCEPLPLNYAAYSNCKTPIQRFQIIFDAGIKYFPKQKGIHTLFRICGEAPFQVSCEQFGHEQVMKVIEDALIRYSDTPINTVDALITAAIDKNVHLDGVYFLLRREPDVLQKLLSSTPVVVMGAVKSNNDNNDDYGSNEGNDGGSNLLVAGSTNSSKKRKRT
jgi:hypothetical protein